MNDKMTQENTKQTSIRLPITLYEKIEALANENDRKPAEQIRFMLKEYIRIKESM